MIKWMMWSAGCLWRKWSVKLCHLACILIVSQVRAQYKYKFLDPRVPLHDQVDDVVSRLSLEEMVSQTMSSGLTPGINRLGIKPYQWWTECLRGHVGQYATAFPQSLGLSATFRYIHSFVYHFNTLGAASKKYIKNVSHIKCCECQFVMYSYCIIE